MYPGFRKHSATEAVEKISSAANKCKKPTSLSNIFAGSAKIMEWEIALTGKTKAKLRTLNNILRQTFRLAEISA